VNNQPLWVPLGGLLLLAGGIMVVEKALRKKKR
jgi:uncharacterized membrane protein YgdD (TMEM256/DUF423 family)